MNVPPRFLLCLVCLLIPAFLQAGTKKSQRNESPGSRTAALRKALEGADKVEILEHRELTLTATITGAAKIGALAKLFTADEKLSASYAKAEPVGGPGDFSITFYKRDEVVARLNQYGERLLGWPKGAWEGNTYMSLETEKLWPRWFEENGFAVMSRRYGEWAEQRQLPQRQEEAFLKCLPDGAKKQIDAFWKRRSRLAQEGLEIADVTGLNKAARTLLDSLGKPHAAGVAICRALGSQADPAFGDGTVFGLNEQAATAAFAQITEYIVPTVFETAIGDSQAATGAARLFFHYGYHGKVPWVLRDGVAPALLRAAVERDQPYFAIEAIRIAGEFGDQRVAAALREIAAGSLTPPTPSRLKMPDEEPSLRYLSALVLSRRGDTEAARLVKELAALPDISKQDLAALAICRCFLAERDTIKPEMFELDSWSIGYFGIAALEKQGDKTALNVMITGATMHSWALVRQEAVHAVQRMTGKVWYRAQTNENEDWYGKDIRDWWQAAQETWTPVNSR